MSEPWVAALGCLAVALFFTYFFMVAWFILRVRPKKAAPPTRYVTYECGEEPEGGAWIRFHPRYYLVALVFVLFDVETVFILPWALNLKGLGLVALVDMGVFLGILLLGWVYALKKGALKWQ